MIWAGNKYGKGIRKKANPKEIGFCPICGGELIPKCGVVKIWHWSHKSLVDCDNWSEPESEWHLNWKDKFPKEQQEVIIQNHRADIKCKDGTIIELQNSSISADDICDREMFYKNMIWLLNGETLGKNFEIRDKESYFTFSWKHPPQSWFYSEKNMYIDLSKIFKEYDEMLEDCLNRIELAENNKISKYVKDINLLKELKVELEELMNKEYLFNAKKIKEPKTIFLIKKLYRKIPCAGWGYLISKEEFLRKFGGNNEN